MSQDYLTEDSILPPNQKYVCMSFLVKEGNNLSGVKIRGAFNTYEDACEHAKKLQSIDESFHVFVGEMGKWLPFNPDPNSIKDCEYANKELNDMMRGYMENQEKAKLFHEQRKNEMIQKNIVENIENRHQHLDELKSKLKTEQNPVEISNLKSTYKTTEEQLKELKVKRKDLEKQIALIKDKIKLYNK